MRVELDFRFLLVAYMLRSSLMTVTLAVALSTSALVTSCLVSAASAASTEPSRHNSGSSTTVVLMLVDRVKSVDTDLSMSFIQ